MIVIIATLCIVGILYVVNDVRKREKVERERLLKEKERSFYEELLKDNLKKEINALADAIIADWNSAVYADKVRTPSTGGVVYMFENGDKVFLKGDTLKYSTRSKNSEWTIGLMYSSRFTTIFNRMVQIINDGHVGRRNRTYTRSSKTGYSGTNRRYNILMDTIKLRRENLAKMKRNDPDREAMENELKAAERMAESMKKN